MINKLNYLLILSAAIAMLACDEDPQDPKPIPPTFQDLCVSSGGTPKDDHTCICNNAECNDHDVCNYESKACPGSEPSFAEACTKTGGTPNGNVCTCSGNSCKEYHTCAEDKTCSEIIPCGTLTFAEACQKTGGTVADESYCVCDGTPRSQYETCTPVSDLSFAEACEKTGGTPDGHYCTCDGEKSNEYETCHECAHQPCGDEKCDGGTTFEDACKASGGTPAEGICVCGGVPCTNGGICQFGIDPATCAVECPPPDECLVKVEGAPCSLDNPLCKPECKNGISLTCDGTKYVKSECDGGNSCKSDTECGTCKNYEQICENKIDAEGKEIGTVMECQEGVPGKAIAMCSNVSCRTDIPACGECLNGELKCTEDNNANAIMYRCVEGKWERLRNKYDPIDPDYSCKKECRIDATLSDRNVNCFNELDAHPEYCDGCDPCAGVGGYEYRAYDWEFNPCYDEAKCKALRAKEADKNDPEYLDPDYPPFRMPVHPATYKATDACKAKGADCPAKEIEGYNYLRGAKEPPSEKFDFDLTNHTFHVSCNADMTRFGQCHNSLQTCINASYHQNGYMIQCVNGTLSDYDGNTDGIACTCKDDSNKSVVCYTRKNCFKNSTAVSGTELCTKPAKDSEFDDL